MPKDSTNALIMMTAQGDTAAFETLYRQMRKPVYFYALHFCGDHALAEDVMQDTFVTVWGKSSSFTPRGDGRSWMLSISKNKALDALKKQKRLSSLDELGDAGCDDRRLASFENKTVLDDLLRILNAKQSDVVLLRHVVGLSLTEIARELNMKKGTVFWMYNNAIKKLRAEAKRIGLL